MRPRQSLPADCSVRELKEADLPMVWNLYDGVLKDMPDPGVFRLHGGADAFFRTHFGERGHSFGVFDVQGLLCAYASLTQPGVEDLDNYARDLGWPVERAARVVQFSSAMVAGPSRGRGLHQVLIDERLRLAARLGHTEVLARAAPANFRSRHNLLGAGFAIVWLGLQGGSLLRHILWRPLQAEPQGGGERPLWLAADDLAGQSAALAAGRRGFKDRYADHAIAFDWPACGTGPASS